MGRISDVNKKQKYFTTQELLPGGHIQCRKEEWFAGLKIVNLKEYRNFVVRFEDVQDVLVVSTMENINKLFLRTANLGYLHVCQHVQRRSSDSWVLVEEFPHFFSNQINPEVWFSKLRLKLNFCNFYVNISLGFEVAQFFSSYVNCVTEHVKKEIKQGRHCSNYYSYCYCYRYYYYY